MHIERLKLTNMRAIETAELNFKPGFNLIVGVNGVGKTTALDALAYCLSSVARDLNRLRASPRAPEAGDIRFGASALTLECGLTMGDERFTYLVHEPSEEAAVAQSGEGKPREQIHELLPRREFIGTAPAAVGKAPPNGRPLAVLFSTRRAASARNAAKQKRAAGGTAAAFAEALDDRELVLSTFAAWMRAQEVLSAERPESQRVLEAFEAATQRFLPGYFNLRVGPEEDPSSRADFRLLIDRGQSASIPVAELTDAEQAALSHALMWADNWMALKWKGGGLGKKATPEALHAARQEARQAKVAEGIARFLPTCRNLRADAAGSPEATIDREPTTIPIGQLSDGERGTLAMVLDLTRRLAQANPHLADPAADAEAVVLIDEIDLHLHPRWQSEVVHNLTTAFPRCQFIATTHSPIVVGDTPAERLTLLRWNNGKVEAVRPGAAYGLTVHDILHMLMDTPPRNEESNAIISRLEDALDAGDTPQARQVLEDLRGLLGTELPETTEYEAVINNLEALADAGDSKGE